MFVAGERGGLTSDAVKAHAALLGFDLCGVSPVDSFPELSLLRTWLDAGHAGEMDYLQRSADRRADVRNVLPSARSVIVFGTIYNADRPYSTANRDTAHAALARYAWGDDYHTVIGLRMARMVEWLRTEVGDSLESRAYVDTGPVQERAYAQRAGIGWVGKNTCVINRRLGSWLFLSEIICNLDLAPDVPALDQCGGCTRCLDACPTGALTAPRVLDSRRCLSYLTIELKGPIPAEHRASVAEHAYGCDICQDVCPYNASAATTVDPAFVPRAELDRPALLDLWRRTDDDLRRILKGSAMKRAGVTRLRRNLAIALGNSNDSAALGSLKTAHSPTCETPLVQEHVEWAIERLGAAVADGEDTGGRD